MGSLTTSQREVDGVVRRVLLARRPLDAGGQLEGARLVRACSVSCTTCSASPAASCTFLVASTSRPRLQRHRRLGRRLAALLTGTSMASRCGRCTLRRRCRLADREVEIDRRAGSRGVDRHAGVFPVGEARTGRSLSTPSLISTTPASGRDRDWASVSAQAPLSGR